MKKGRKNNTEQMPLTGKPEHLLGRVEVFKKMYERTKGTILIISHQERILDIADKVVVIADGRVSATGSKDEILPELLHASAGCRYTTTPAPIKKEVAHV